jgi:hypothetical protein
MIQIRNARKGVGRNQEVCKGIRRNQEVCSGVGRNQEVYRGVGRNPERKRESIWERKEEGRTEKEGWGV